LTTRQPSRFLFVSDRFIATLFGGVVPKSLVCNCNARTVISLFGDALPPETPHNPHFVSISSDSVTPPRVAGRARIDTLLEDITPQSIASLLEFLPTIESTPLLSYVGHRLGEVCRPEIAPVIERGLRMKSVHFLEGCLSKLATREYERFVQKQTPLLEGERFVEVRRLLGEICCEPNYMVSETAWASRHHEVLAISALPLSILRRCAGPEVAEVAVTAFTRGGIGPYMNRKALDLLKLYEERSTERVLSEGDILLVATVLDENLRDENIHASLISLLDSWLSKGSDVDAGSVRDLLLYEVDLLTRNGSIDFDTELPRLLGALKLLRHFKDDGVHRLITRAVELEDPTISPVALLCLRDAKVSSLERLAELVSADVDEHVRYRALMVFGQSISSIADTLSFSVLERYLKYSDEMLRSSGAIAETAIRERKLLLECACRRFYSEPLGGPFMKSLFSAAVDTSEERAAVKSFAVNVFGQIAQGRRLPPIWLYDDFDRILALRRVADHLEARLRGIGFPDNISPADQIRNLFFASGPRHYGFEIDFS
jgi:hypothetical protein